LIGKIRKSAKPPERVAAAVERQLTRRRLRPRTLVGADARLILVMKAMLPTNGLDAVWSQGITAAPGDPAPDGRASSRTDSEPTIEGGRVRSVKGVEE
jgi:hypothetical protein